MEEIYLAVALEDEEDKESKGEDVSRAVAAINVVKIDFCHEQKEWNKTRAPPGADGSGS